MLSATHRMRSSAEFGRTVRAGVRAATPSVVVHLTPPTGAATEDPDPVRVGFVVSRGVGPAVVRNRVKRRLRHLARPEIDQTPTGSTVVIRALPPAATTPDLASDLHAAWSRALTKAGRGS